MLCPSFVTTEIGMPEVEASRSLAEVAPMVPINLSCCRANVTRCLKISVNFPNDVGSDQLVQGDGSTDP
jgi:hypothetical protein